MYYRIISGLGEQSKHRKRRLHLLDHKFIFFAQGFITFFGQDGKGNGWRSLCDTPD